ncbi:hypothetical protein [Sabulicella rubraurantiaca]|uniref:hypothetical protein n=1 Tax=Sabulicella rubraurantiaca TaxID=2811429 RepID=UPI001A957F11|nr:hypothetical protein [Sabulicella rubraurantiaca]
MATKAAHPYCCYWLSPRGFANEGDYVYGSREDCEAAVQRLDLKAGARVVRVSQHRSLEAAKKSAEEKAAKDSERYQRRNEMDHIGCCAANSKAHPGTWA